MAPFAEELDSTEKKANWLRSEWKARSILGQVGHAIEPVVEPLGWDWRIGTAALASFPAREVVVGTLGIIYSLGEVDTGEIKDAPDAGETDLGKALKAATWESGPKKGQLVFSIPVALSLMVFFALCAQCASTLAVIKRETRSWGWSIFTFVYMTALAYVGALVVFQTGSLFARQQPETVREISLAGLKHDMPKNRFDMPTALASNDEVTKSFPEADVQGRVKKDVDFQKQQLLFFAWSGSGQDKLAFKVEKGKKGPEVIFAYQPGATDDLKGHFHLFAVPKDATWRLSDK